MKFNFALLRRKVERAHTHRRRHLINKYTEKIANEPASDLVCPLERRGCAKFLRNHQRWRNEEKNCHTNKEFLHFLPPNQKSALVYFSPHRNVKIRAQRGINPPPQPICTNPPSPSRLANSFVKTPPRQLSTLERESYLFCPR
jgi:hypothetical protein